MPRQTVDQIVEMGDYLQPEFEPRSLTIRHLCCIFIYHQIAFPSLHNKAMLVKIFNDKIKANGAHLLRQHLEMLAKPASMDGIVDGITGKPIALSGVPKFKPDSNPSRVEKKNDVEGSSQSCSQTFYPGKESDWEYIIPICNRSVGRERSIEGHGFGREEGTEDKPTSWDDVPMDVDDEDDTNLAPANKCHWMH